LSPDREGEEEEKERENSPPYFFQCLLVPDLEKRKRTSSLYQ
jgi:hypothetical protein